MQGDRTININTNLYLARILTRILQDIMGCTYIIISGHNYDLQNVLEYLDPDVESQVFLGLFRSFCPLP